MTIKHFMSSNPSWIQTSHQEVYGGQELKVDPGWEMMELITWWREWREIMRNSHPSVQDAIHQVKVLHTITKEERQ